MIPFTVTSAALSLLLVFRTNASYDRWWEGRKLWGLLLIRSRDFVRQGLTFFGPDEDELKARLVRYTTAFNYALKVHLRGDEDLKTELKDVLEPKELDAALQDPHPSNHILFVLSTIVNRAKINNLQASRMDENLTTFSDILGACERILRAPIPLSYTRHTSRSLILWLTLLPMALVGDCGWLTIPIEAFIAMVLLGIEDIGVQIEEPFSILPLEAICKTVDANNRALYGQQRSVWELAEGQSP
ncbi:hypothetical protein CYMTET_17814 [Cymbomonas tetramitiformis]|uniref:Uncharacterized protein n=1 Tax=Cymbomonas tetramitiformis TaxID=36881 RepID=A0AAE0L6W7_9CHLO|nr:hypothetical protein CYMTET_17814 [Cymbomonas tetramitiformis]|eukprot:gene21970-26461_t